MPERKPNFAIDVFPKSCKQCKQFMGRDYLHLKRYFFLLLYEHLSDFTQSVLQHMRLYVGNHRVQMEGLPENIEGWKTKQKKVSIFTDIVIFIVWEKI